MRVRSCLTLILLPIGLLVAAIAGKLLFLVVTRQPLHQGPQAISSAIPTEPSPEWAEAVNRTRRMIREGIAEQNVPGLSVAVGAGGRIVWAEGFGLADIAARAPVTVDTRFRIGTASTVLTSAAVGVLVEKGLLNLDEEIQTYVPQYPKKQWPVTPRQLMGHVGGVGTDGGNEGPLFRQRCEKPVEALEHFAADALLFEPGTEYRHSKYGWILVSAAVEAAGGRPFLAFLGEQVFRPLGMSHTGAESSTEENPEAVGEEGEDPPFATLISQLILEPLGVVAVRAHPATTPATVYFPGFGKGPLVRYGLGVEPARNLSCYAGAMAFYSTPSDLVRFGLAIHGGRLLRPATVRLLQMSQPLRSGQQTGYGLGWELDTVTLAGGPAQPAAGHDGEFRGRVVVSLLLLREAGIVVAVTANSPGGDTRALARRVAEAFAERAFELDTAKFTKQR